MKTWLHALAVRLEHVRITCGNWRRVLTPAVLRAKLGDDHSIAVFLDPPYSISGDVYCDYQAGIDAQACQWALEHGDTYRIIIAGYDHDHDLLLAHGWRRIIGKAAPGYHKTSKTLTRERLWLSPTCLPHAPTVSNR